MTASNCVLVEAEPLLAANYQEALLGVCGAVHHYRSVRALLRAPQAFELLVIGIELLTPATVSAGRAADFTIDGLSELRGRWPEQKLIVLSSREDHVLHPSIAGLAADDVLPKRVPLAVLQSHTKRVMQRQTTGQLRNKANHGLAIDREQSLMWWNGALLRSSITEFDLIQCLVANTGRTVSQAEMREHLQLPYDYVGLAVLVKVVINKFRAVDPTFHALEVIYGSGYRWVEGSDEPV